MAIQQYNSSKSYPRTYDLSSHKMLTIIIVPERTFFHVEQVSNLIRKQLATLDSPATTVLVGVACLADEYYITQGSVLDKTIGTFFSPSSLHNTFRHYESYQTGKKFPGQFEIDFLYPAQKMCDVFSSRISLCIYGAFLILSNGNLDAIYQNQPGTHIQNEMSAFPLSQPCNTPD